MKIKIYRSAVNGINEQLTASIDLVLAVDGADIVVIHSCVVGTIHQELEFRIEEVIQEWKGISPFFGTTEEREFLSSPTPTSQPTS